MKVPQTPLVSHMVLKDDRELWPDVQVCVYIKYMCFKEWRICGYRGKPGSIFVHGLDILACILIHLLE